MSQRIFVAIELDAVTQQFLAEVRQPLQQLLPSVRFVAAETWHITLAFIGDSSAKQVKATHHALQAAVADVACFSLHIQGVGTFGTTTLPTVLWAGVAGDIVVLERVRQQLVQQLQDAAIPVQSPHMYHPHITLARLRRTLPASEHNLLMAQRQPQQPTGPQFTVTAINLMESILAPSGAQYTQLATVPLVP